MIQKTKTLIEPIETKVIIPKEQILINATRELLYFCSIIRLKQYNIDATKLHSILINKMSELIIILSENNFSIEEMNTVKYLLSAALDEAILSSTESIESGHQSLTNHYYKGELGGIYFFENLAILQKDFTKNLPIIQLALLILSIGFKGQYAISDNGLFHLSQIKDNLYIALKKARNTLIENTVVLTTVPNTELKNTLKKYLIPISSVSIALIGMTYTIMYQNLTSKTSELHKLIKEIFYL